MFFFLLYQGRAENKNMSIGFLIASPYSWSTVLIQDESSWIVFLHCPHSRTWWLAYDGLPVTFPISSSRLVGELSPHFLLTLLATMCISSLLSRFMNSSKYSILRIISYKCTYESNGAKWNVTLLKWRCSCIVQFTTLSTYITNTSIRFLHTACVILVSTSQKNRTYIKMFFVTCIHPGKEMADTLARADSTWSR